MWVKVSVKSAGVGKNGCNVHTGRHVVGTLLQLELRRQVHAGRDVRQGAQFREQHAARESSQKNSTTNMRGMSQERERRRRPSSRTKRDKNTVKIHQDFSHLKRSNVKDAHVSKEPRHCAAPLHRGRYLQTSTGSFRLTRTENI